jgi:hypothetical protein
MSMSDSKKLRLAVIFFAAAVLLLGLLIFYFSSQDSQDQKASVLPAITQATQPDFTLVRSKPKEMVRKEGNVAEDEQSQAAQRFVSAEQLCNSFTLKTLGKLDPMEFLEALQDHIQGTDHAIEDWLRTVAISGSPRQKGAALSLLVAVTGRALRRGAYARMPNCDEVKECTLQLEEAIRNRTSPFAYALVNAAIYASDPALYGMAYSICKRYSFSNDAVCGRVDAMQWLRRDPDNGVAAIYALAEMKLPSLGEDGTAFENALYRLSLAKRFDFYFDLRRELPQLPSALDDYQHRIELDSMLYHFRLISPLPPNRNVISACTIAHLKNPNRRFTCEAIANQYLREDATLIDRAIFMKIAVDLEWDKAKLQEITDDFDAVKAYFWEINRREAIQVQNASGQITACQLNLKQFIVAAKNPTEGEFMQYKQEAKEFYISRDELIKMGRRMRERR